MIRAVSLLVLALSACQTGPSSSRVAIGHDVYFTLTTSSELTIAELVDDCRGLAAIPSVRHLTAGPLSRTLDSENNVRDFHVALHVEFTDHKGFDRYVIHPIHRSFLTKWRSKLRSVRVFDYEPGAAPARPAGGASKPGQPSKPSKPGG